MSRVLGELRRGGQHAVCVVVRALAVQELCAEFGVGDCEAVRGAVAAAVVRLLSVVSVLDVQIQVEGAAAVPV